MNQLIRGDILWLKCINCSAEFPVFVFAGESDLATDELRTSTDVHSKILFIFNRSDSLPGGSEVELADVETQRRVPEESFKEFQNRQKGAPARHSYKCIHCNLGKTSIVEKLSEQELISKGYRLIKKM